MAGRLHQIGRNHWSTARSLENRRSCRLNPSTGTKIGRREAPCVEPGGIRTTIDNFNVGFCGAIVYPQFLPDSESSRRRSAIAAHCKITLSPLLAKLVFAISEPSTFSDSFSRRWRAVWAGSARITIAISCSKDFETAKKWGYHSGPNPAAGVELPEKTPVREKHILELEQIPRLLAVLRRTGSHHGPVGVAHRVTHWRDSGLELGQCRFRHRADSGDAGLLPRHDGKPQDQEQQTICAPAGGSQTPLLRDYANGQSVRKRLVFHTSKGTPYNDSNLLHRDLKPAGRKLGMPWLNWHTLRRTHATLFQLAGGSLRDAQAQLGHSKMSTTLEIYTLPIPEQQRATVEKLSVLMADDGRKGQNPEGLPLALAADSMR